MGKIKGNNADVALKAIKGTPEFANVKVPTEIDILEHDMFHVISLIRRHDRMKQNYVVDVRHLKFHENQFLGRKGSKGAIMGIQDMLKQIGQPNVFILHDPRKPIAEMQPAKPVAVKLETTETGNVVKESDSAENTEVNETETTETVHWRTAVKNIQEATTIEEAQKWVAMFPESQPVLTEYEKKATELESK